MNTTIRTWHGKRDDTGHEFFDEAVQQARYEKLGDAAKSRLAQMSKNSVSGCYINVGRSISMESLSQQ